MTPFELAMSVRGQNAETRGNVFRALSAEEVVQLQATLVAAALVEGSGIVRGVLNELLEARPAAAKAVIALPDKHLDLELQAQLVGEFCGIPGFAEGLLAYDRGAELLGRVDPQGHLLEDRLIELIPEAPAELLGNLLRLPLDFGGRLCAVLANTARLQGPAREALGAAIADAALSEGGVVRDDERERGRAAFLLWFLGLVRLNEEHEVDAPEFATFVQSGASFGTGVVTRVAEPPSEATVEALRPLTRALYLRLGPPAHSTQLDREAFWPDTSSPSGELRVAAWRLLLANELAGASEALDAALAAPEPGVRVELLRLLPPGGLGSAQVEGLVGLLSSPRLCVRRAASEVLARDPQAAALAASSIDPRSPDAPLSILMAQPAALASASLQAYLEVDRDEDQAATALRGLLQPPTPTWSHWKRLLRAGGATGTAARVALLRLPPEEAPELERLLSEVEDDGLEVACAARYSLPGRHDAAARLLSQESLEGDLAAHAVDLLAGYADLRAWVLLWDFVVGDRRGRGARSRLRGGRSSRRRALVALRSMRPPGLPANEQRPREWPWWGAKVQPGQLPDRALKLLLSDRDPEQSALALLWLEHHPPSLAIAHGIEDLTWQTLSVVRARPRVAWRRCLRRLLPRRLIAPSPGQHRGRAGRARLLAGLFDSLLRRGSRVLAPALIEPLLDHPNPRVAQAATRLLVGLLQASLDRVVASSRVEVVDEAIRVGHPAEVEAVIARRLAQALLYPESDVAARALAWVALRPSPSYLPQLERLFVSATGQRRDAVVKALREIHRLPNGRTPTERLLARALEAASADRAEGRLRATLEAVARFGAWGLVAQALPALAWGGETTRRRLRTLLREAADAGQRLDPSAIEPLLLHALSEVRTLAVSLLRKSGERGLWPMVRPAGPGVRQRPTDFSKLFLGLCEDQFEASMTLSIESLLDHPNGEVARRALKLLNRREQEISAAPLLARLDDPELRQPILTTFSTWSRRFVPPGLSAEQLEEHRRRLRATLAQLCEGPRGQVLGLLPEARVSQVPYLRAAALLAIGRLFMEDEREHVVAGLADTDPMLVRAAAVAAASLGPDEKLDAALAAQASAPSAEVRASVRVAIVRRASADDVEAVEALLGDRAPEVTLVTLRACRAAPALLGELTLTPFLADADARVREAVLVTLAAASGPAEGDPVLAALAGALRDPSPDVRLAALEVAEAWDAVEGLAPAMGNLLSDSSLQVSSKALDLLGESMGADLGGRSVLRGQAGDDDVDNNDSDVGGLEDSSDESDEDEDTPSAS